MQRLRCDRTSRAQEDEELCGMSDDALSLAELTPREMSAETYQDVVIPVLERETAVLRPVSEMHHAAEVITDREGIVPGSGHGACEIIEVWPDAARAHAPQCARSSK
jgi:hypothetical protein